MKTANENQDALWDIIAREKRRDTMVKWVSRGAWVLVLAVLTVFLIFTIQDYIRVQELYKARVVARATVKETFIPFLVILGCLSLIIAVLATIGMFLRLRTTSMLEIQQRLANLEQMITSEK